MLRLSLAALHLLALGIGLGAVWARARALGGELDDGALRRAFTADSWWGIAALLWLVTGLWRLLAGTEKLTSYYMHNHVFFAKMGLFVLVLVLEVWPMTKLIRWRIAVRRGIANGGGTANGVTDPGIDAADVATAGWISTISYAQAAIIVLIVIAAVTMARGYGVTG